MPTDGQSDSFVAIGNGVYLKRGHDSKRVDTSINPGSKNPTVVLIFGWMGAQLRHLHKYTQVYDEIYPEATQILIRCRPSFFWSTEQAKQTRLTPVAEVLEALGCITLARKDAASTKRVHLRPPAYSSFQPRILVHAFSNGGSFQLVSLGKMLSQASIPGSTLQALCAVIFDSCPGSGGLSNTKLAFTGAIKSPLTRHLAGLFISILYFYFYFLSLAFGKKTPAQVLRQSLHNPRLLPWVDTYTPRLYLYSKEDELIPWKEVEEHAAESETLGIDTRAVLFEQSPHVAHARTNPGKYWSAVRQVWAHACEVEAEQIQPV